MHVPYKFLGSEMPLLSLIVGTYAYNCTICVPTNNNAKLYSGPLEPRVKLTSVQVRVKFLS